MNTGPVYEEFKVIDRRRGNIDRRGFLARASWGAVVLGAGPRAALGAGAGAEVPVGYRPWEPAGEDGRFRDARAFTRVGTPVRGAVRVSVLGFGGDLRPEGRFGAGLDLHVRFLPHHRVAHRAWSWSPAPHATPSPPVAVTVPPGPDGSIHLGLEPHDGSEPVPFRLGVGRPGFFWIALRGDGRPVAWRRCVVGSAGAVTDRRGGLPCLRLRVEAVA